MNPSPTVRYLSNLPVRSAPHHPIRTPRFVLPSSITGQPLVRARPKSAKKWMLELESKRRAKMTARIINSPVHAAALIERLPVVMRPLKTWEIDMMALRAMIHEELENKVTTSAFPESYTANPEWAETVVKDIFQDRSQIILDLANKVKKDDVEAVGKKGKAAAVLAAGEGDKKKSKKQLQKEERAAASGKTAVPAAASAKTEAATPATEDSAMAELKKSFASLGIEMDMNDDDKNDNEDEDDKKKSSLQMHTTKKKEEEAVVEFEAESRLTEADRTNDLRSLDRKLWHTLYLVIKPVGGKWGLPKTVHKENERMIEAAKRASQSVFPQPDKEKPTDSDVDLYFVSACPSGYRSNGDALEFFYRAQFLGGEFDQDKCPTPIEDFAWLTGAELAERLAGDEDEVQYLKRVFGDDHWEIEEDLSSRPLYDDFGKKKLKDVTRQTWLEREKQRLGEKFGKPTWRDVREAQLAKAAAAIL